MPDVERLLSTRLSPLRAIARQILGRSAESPSPEQMEQLLWTQSPTRLPELPGSQLTLSPSEVPLRAGVGETWTVQPGSESQALLPTRRGALARLNGLPTHDHFRGVMSRLPSMDGDDELERELGFEDLRGRDSYEGYRLYDDAERYPYSVVTYSGLGPNEGQITGHFAPQGPHHTRLTFNPYGAPSLHLDELQSDYFSATKPNVDQARQITDVIEQTREEQSQHEPGSGVYRRLGSDIRRFEDERRKALSFVEDPGPMRSLWPRVLFNDAVLRGIDDPEAQNFTWSPSDVHNNLYGAAADSGATEMYENLYDRLVPRMAQQLHRRLGVPYVPMSYQPSRDAINPGAAAPRVEVPGFRITDELRRAAQSVNQMVDDPRPSGFSLPLYAEGGPV